MLRPFADFWKPPPSRTPNSQREWMPGSRWCRWNLPKKPPLRRKGHCLEGVGPFALIDGRLVLFPF